MLHLYAALSEKERRMIGQRTRDALAQKKLQGVKLGNPSNLPEAGALGAARNAANAVEFAKRLEKTVRGLQATGASLRSIAKELNTNGMATARGKAWTAATVSRLIAKLPAGVDESVHGSW